MATPSHVDLSVLWVPIMPETSKLGEQMEKVGQDATESFGKGSSGIGDKLHENFSKSKDKLRDVFHRSGKDASDAMADGVKENSKKVEDVLAEAGEKATSRFGETAKGLGKQLVEAIGPDTKQLLGDRLEETVGGALEGVLGDNAKWVGKFSHTLADWGFEELKTKLGDTKEAAQKTRAAFVDFGKGDTLGGVSKLVEGFDKMGVGVKDLPGPIQTVIGDIGEARSAAEEFAGIFKDMPGVVGRVGSAIENLAGPIGVAAAAAMAIWNGLPGIGGGLSQIINSTNPSNGFVPPASQDIQQTPAGLMPLPGMPQPVAASSIPAEGQGHEYVATQGSLDPFAALLPPGMAPPDLSKPSPIAPIDMPDGVPAPVPPKSKSAPAPSAFIPPSSGVPLVQKPDGTWTSSNPAWAHLIQRESGGNPSVFNNYDSNAQAGDPSQGLFQFTRATWARSGGLKYGRDPSRATPQQQAEIAANLIRSNPSGSDWGAGMSGRENASALLSGVGPGGATGGDSLSDVLASSPSGGGGGGRSSGGQAAPLGTQHDPVYTTAVDSEGKTQSDSDDPNSKQLGSGFLDGIMQSVGLDGSVFKSFGGASNPMDFGVTKLGTGLLNWGMGMAQQRTGGGGGDGSMLPGLGALIPHAPVAAPTQPGNTTIVHGDVNSGFQVTQHGVQGDGTQGFGEAYNSSVGSGRATAAPLPNASFGPSAGMP